MRMMIVHAAVLGAFAVLFLWSRGTFARTSRLINRRFLDPLGLRDAEVKLALLIVFAANILGALSLAAEWSGSTVRDGYLIREDYGGASYVTGLDVDLGGEKGSVEIEVPSRMRTEEETDELLSVAAARLPDLVLHGMPASRVDSDLYFAETVGDAGIRASFMTSDPALVDWDGKLGRTIPPAGADVTLTADLILDDHVKEITICVTVYPKALTDAEKFGETVTRAVESANAADAGSDRFTLPETIDGRPASWSAPASSSGLSILAIGLIAAVLFLFSKLQNRGIETDKKRQQLLLDYPHVISRLVLLLNAGMSMRTAFARIAADYRKELARGGRVREGYEVILKASYEMEKGVSEIDAYAHIGKNTPEVRYKTFSTLLVQNLRKGSRELVGILEREAAEAFEERKKEARILGEQAGTKLMFPMLLMLGVVIVILMLPAYLSFQG